MPTVTPNGTRDLWRLEANDIIKVLLVDDEPQVLELTTFFLERGGLFEIDSATSARSAFEKMSQKAYDAVVADFQMPDIDGLELLKILRNQGSNISYILFTGKGREDVAIQALNLGADFYLQKGGDTNSLYAEMSNMIMKSVERRNAQDQLHESERRFREFLSNAHHAAVILNREGKIEFINEYLLKLAGREGESVEGLDWFELFIPEDSRVGLRRMYVESIKAEKLRFSRPHINEILVKNGTKKRFAWDNTILLDHEGHLTGVASLGEDLSDEAPGEGILSPLVENAEDLMFRYRLSPSPGFVYVNPAATRITGYTPEEHYADPQLGIRIVDPEDRPRFEAVLEDPRSAKTPLTLRWRHKDGRTVWTEQRLVPVLDSSGSVVALDGIARDITERKVLDEVVERSRLEYMNLVESAPCIICRLKPDGETVFVNDYVEKLTGFKPVELIGRNWWDVFYPGELRAQVESLYKNFNKGDVGGSEMTLRARDGRPRTLLWTSFNTFDRSDGHLLEINGAGTDITELKHNQEMLQHLNEKLSLLGSITRHDVQNQLAVLLGWVDIALDDVKDEQIMKQLQSAKSAADTIRKQLEFTADYQEMGMASPIWIAAKEALEQGTSTLTLGGVTVSSDLEGLEIYADPMVHKVFHNLVDNSLRHGKRVDQIRLSYKASDDEVRLTYEDNGIGIPAKEKPLVFERGFGKHTGYGLHLSREILAITGIQIRETGEEGKGARFELVLPKGSCRLVRKS